MADPLQRGEIWSCWKCGELLLVLSKEGWPWVRLEAERLSDQAGLTRLVCPACKRVNARRVEVPVPSDVDK